jgi:hypothetical protein
MLNRRVEIARWVTFAFSILGALLAAIASQLNDPQRMYFAIAGAGTFSGCKFLSRPDFLEGFRSRIGCVPARHPKRSNEKHTDTQLLQTHTTIR